MVSAGFLDRTVWHLRILAILQHNAVCSPFEFKDLLVIGTLCFKFSAQALIFDEPLLNYSILFRCSPSSTKRVDQQFLQSG